jgi:hypothetical protein
MDDMDYQEIIERRRNRNRNVEYSDELGGKATPDNSDDDGLFWDKPKAGTRDFPSDYPDTVVGKKVKK